MRLRYKSFRLCTDILKFVEDEKIDVDNIVSISSAAKRGWNGHFLWWKEEEEKYTITMPLISYGGSSMEEIEGRHINLSDGKSRIICCLIDEIKRLTK